MYDRLGRAAIRFSLVYLRRRYRRQIRIGSASPRSRSGSPPTRRPQRTRGLTAQRPRGLKPDCKFSLHAYGQPVRVR